MSDMKCPFCNGELVGTIGHPICRNQNCVMCDDPMPQDLLEELIRTREALDVANEKLRHCVNITVEELDKLKGNLLIAHNALLHFSKDPIAINALKKITASKQGGDNE